MVVVSCSLKCLAKFDKENFVKHVFISKPYQRHYLYNQAAQ